MNPLRKLLAMAKANPEHPEKVPPPWEVMSFRTYCFDMVSRGDTLIITEDDMRHWMAAVDETSCDFPNMRALLEGTIQHFCARKISITPSPSLCNPDAGKATHA